VASSGIQNLFFHWTDRSLQFMYDCLEAAGKTGKENKNEDEAESPG
jgi:hypothetical protein